MDYITFAMTFDPVKVAEQSGMSWSGAYYNGVVKMCKMVAYLFMLNKGDRCLWNRYMHLHVNFTNLNHCWI